MSLSSVHSDGEPSRTQSQETARRRGVRCALLLLVAGAAAAPAQFEGVEPGQIFHVDLGSRSISQEGTQGAATLPFDVHFFFRGKVDATTREVGARYVAFRKPQNCQNVVLGTEVVVQYSRDGEPRRREAGQPLFSFDLGTTQPFDDQTDRVFEILVPALRPNRYYCFEFRQLSEVSPARREELRTTLAEAVGVESSRGRYYAPATVAGEPLRIFDPTVANYETFRAAVNAAAREGLRPGETLRAPGGSYFDHPGTGFEEVTADFRLELGAVMDLQAQREEAKLQFDERSLAAAEALARLHRATFGDPARPLSDLLAEAGGTLDLPAEADPEGAPRGTGLVPPLVGLDGLVAVARGLEPAAAPERAVDELVAEVPRRVGRIESRAAALVSLLDRLDERQEAFRRETGVDLDSPERSPPEGETARALGSLLRAAADALGGSTAPALLAVAERDAAWHRAIDELVDRLMVDVTDVVRLRGTTVADYETRRVWYLSADIGAGLAWQTDDIFTYVGANIYFRPINKKSHLRWVDYPRRPLEELGRRFAVTIGLVQSGIEGERFQPVIMGSQAILGAGLRLNDSLRLSAGAIVYEEMPPDPMAEAEGLELTPFIALSIDWNAKEAVDKILGNISGN